MAIITPKDLRHWVLWQRRALRHAVTEITGAQALLRMDKRERLRKEASGLLFFTPYRPPEGVLRYHNIRCEQLADGGDWVEFILMELMKLRPDPAQVSTLLGITPARYRECSAGLSPLDDYFLLKLVLAGAESREPLTAQTLLCPEAPLRSALLASCSSLAMAEPAEPKRRLLSELRFKGAKG